MKKIIYLNIFLFCFRQHTKKIWLLNFICIFKKNFNGLRSVKFKKIIESIKEIENKKFKEKTIKVLLDFLSSDSERSFVLP